MTQKIIDNIVTHTGVTDTTLVEYIVNTIQRERIVDMAVVGCNRPDGSRHSDLKKVTAYLQSNNVIRFNYQNRQYVWVG